MQLSSSHMPGLQQILTTVKGFLLLLVAHCKQDKITVSAGHLAYVSLLSLVPFIMVFFTILSAFPAFAEARGDLETLIFNSFVPTAGNQVQTYMTEFVSNASGMGAVGILSLVIVALMLISNIDRTLNSIWQSQNERPLIFTFAIYWMVLTLGPLLMGSSVIMSSYLIGLANYAEEFTPGVTTILLKTLPFIASISTFFLIYMLVPNKKIVPKNAAFGALVATILFEASKKAFALYVTSFPSYQLIYGALAIIPILFVWVYLSWVVVLIGAEVTHVLEIFLGNGADDIFTKADDEISSSS
jgi:membrane protein